MSNLSIVLHKYGISVGEIEVNLALNAFLIQVEYRIISVRVWRDCTSLPLFLKTLLMLLIEAKRVKKKKKGLCHLNFFFFVLFFSFWNLQSLQYIEWVIIYPCFRNSVVKNILLYLEAVAFGFNHFDGSSFCYWNWNRVCFYIILKSWVSKFSAFSIRNRVCWSSYNLLSSIYYIWGVNEIFLEC